MPKASPTEQLKELAGTMEQITSLTALREEKLEQLGRDLAAPLEQIARLLTLHAGRGDCHGGEAQLLKADPRNPPEFNEACLQLGLFSDNYIGTSGAADRIEKALAERCEQVGVIDHHLKRNSRHDIVVPLTAKNVAALPEVLVDVRREVLKDHLDYIRAKVLDVQGNQPVSAESQALLQEVLGEVFGQHAMAQGKRAQVEERKR